MKRIIYKDFLRSLAKSKGRFLSIFFLIFLGTFAYIGLKSAGPDMRSTANEFSKEMNIADTTIISTWGLNKSDQETIKNFENVEKIEFGYFQDSELTSSSKSLRLFSKPDKISKYVVDSGRLPNRGNEIALDFSQKKEYKLNDEISFKNPKESNILKQHTFKIVGFVKSSESIGTTDLGPSTVGTGKLNGYGVISKNHFDSELYTIARLTLDNVKNLDRTSSTYKNRVKKQVDKMNKELKTQGTSRLSKTKSDEQKKISDGYKEIEKSKSELIDAENTLKESNNELVQGSKDIIESQAKLDSTVAAGKVELQNGADQIGSGKKELASAEKALKDAKSQLSEGTSELQNNWSKLQSAKLELQKGKEILKTNYSQLTEADTNLITGRNELAALSSQLEGYSHELNQKQTEINEGQTQIASQKQENEKSQEEISANQKEIEIQLSSIESKKKALAEAIDKQKDQLSDKEKIVTDLQKRIKLIKTTINQLNTEKLEAENNQDTEEVARLETEITAKENELTQLIEQQDGLKTEIAQVQQNIADAETSYQGFLTDTYKPEVSKLSEKQEELNVAQKQLDNANQEILNQQNLLNEYQKELNLKQVELNQQKEQLAASQKTLAEKETEYQKGLKEYNEGIESYNANLAMYYKGIKEWQSAFSLLNENTDEYKKNLDAYHQGKDELAEQEAELAKGESTLLNEQRKNQEQINNAKDDLAKGQVEYQKGLEQFNKQKEKAKKEILDNEKKLTEAQNELDHLSAPTYSVKSHEDYDNGYKAFVDSSDRIDILSNIFPVFLFAVAALVSLTTMTRFVEEERLNIGIYKAMGYSDWDIKKKFLLYGLIASLLGTILGTIAGHILLPKIIYDVYAAGTSLPSISFSIYPIYTLIGLVIAILCTVVSTYIVITKDLNERPSTLLLPKPPKEGSRIFLEKVTPIWKNLSFNHKITARNLFRYKKRMLMTIFGVAGCMALLITAFGIKDSISGITKRQSEELLKYDLLVSKEEFTSEKDQASIEKLLMNKDIKEYTEIYYEELTANTLNNSTQTITEIVTDNSSKFEHFISLKDINKFQQQNLPIDGVVLSEKLANLLGVKIGDQVTFENSRNQKLKAKVSGITEMYLGHFMFMSSQAYQKIYQKSYKGNSYLINLKNSNQMIKNDQAALFMKQNGVNGVVQSNSSEDGSIEGLSQITLLLIVGASLLALVVIYTLSNINVSERIRELSTIKVLGFYDQEVTMYIYRETIILSIIGIFVGSLGGTILTKFITTILPTDEVMFDTAIKWSNYGTSTLITLSITLGLMVFIHKKIKNVNMLDALKSVD